MGPQYAPQWPHTSRSARLGKSLARLRQQACPDVLSAPVGVRALAFSVRLPEVTWLSRAIAGVVSRAADIGAADRSSSFIIQFLHWLRKAATFSKLPIGLSL